MLTFCYEKIRCQFPKKRTMVFFQKNKESSKKNLSSRIQFGALSLDSYLINKQPSNVAKEKKTYELSLLKSVLTVAINLPLMLYLPHV